MIGEQDREQLVPKETPKKWEVVLNQYFAPFTKSVIQKTPSGYKTEVIIEDLQNLKITMHAARYREPLIHRDRIGVPTIGEISPGNSKDVLAVLRSPPIGEREIQAQNILQITAESEKGLRLFELPEVAKLLSNLHLTVGAYYSFDATPEKQALKKGQLKFVHFESSEPWFSGEFILLEPTEPTPRETSELGMITSRFYIPNEDGDFRSKLLEVSRLLRV